MAALGDFFRLVLDFDVLTHDTPQSYFTKADKFDTKVTHDPWCSTVRVRVRVRVRVSV